MPTDVQISSRDSITRPVYNVPAQAGDLIFVRNPRLLGSAPLLRKSLTRCRAVFRSDDPRDAALDQPRHRAPLPHVPLHAQVRTTPLKNGGDHSFGGRFGPLRNGLPVLWCPFLESWRQDGENSEKTEKKRAKMGEIQPNKKSAGCPSMLAQQVAFVTAAVQVAVPFKSLTIVVPPNRGPLNKTAGILSRVIRSKSGNCSVRIAPDRPTAGLSLTLKIENSLGPEAFAATYDGANEAIIAGGDRMGVLFGAGAFLRASQFRSTGFVPPQSSALGSPWEAKDAPKTPGSFRAIYMASHFGNYFVNAPLDEVYEYLEDVALWGANSLVITGADAGRLANLSQAMPILTRNVKIGIHAKLLGMRVGSMFTNEGFTSQPPGIAYTSPAGVGDKGDFGPFMHLVCPAKGLGYLKDHVYGPIFGNISSLGLSLDYIIAWRKKASIRLLIRQRLSPSR